MPYLWLCGTGSVNHHTLSDFRVRLERLLIDTIATLMHQGLISLETVAQDGMRVKASAGSSSFRRKRITAEFIALGWNRIRDDGDQGRSKKRTGPKSLLVGLTAQSAHRADGRNGDHGRFMDAAAPAGLAQSHINATAIAQANTTPGSHVICFDDPIPELVPVA